MDDSVMQVLKMLEEGKISAKEAETLIGALRGESGAPPPPDPPAPPKPEERSFPNFDFVSNLKAPKLDFDDLGQRISKAVSKVQPEKIVKKIQTQLRTATQNGAQWSATVSHRVKTWTEGVESRPENYGGLPDFDETQEHEFHLDAGASVLIENPLGNVTLVGTDSDVASVSVRKIIWAPRTEELKPTADRVEVNIHGTDAKLEIRVSAPDGFREGVADLELRVPKTSLVRVSTAFGRCTISGIDGRTEAVTRSGNLVLRNLGGDARGETASGDLTLDDIACTATVATQSGDIQADNVRRGLSANTASGDVRVTGIEGGRVECKSVSGDVLAERVGVLNPLDITVESVSGDTSLSYASGNISLKTVSGDVKAIHLRPSRVQVQAVSGEVHISLEEPFSGNLQIDTVSGEVHADVPEGSNLRVTLSTSSGELRCEHDAHDVVATDTLWTGRIGSGDGTLNVRTISGETHIGRA